MFRYVFGFSPSERLLGRLSLRASARIGKLIAALSAAGWIVFVREFALAAMTSGPLGLHSPRWLLLVAIVAILPTALWGRLIAERDLEARIDTTTGRGKRWRWSLAVQFWGVWAYWLFAARTLPTAVEQSTMDATVRQAAV